MLRSDLPFGSEFSPSQVDLIHLLELARTYGGDWKAFEDAIRVTYFDEHATTEYNRRKLANNTKLAMIAYDLIDRDARLTDLGRELYDLRDDPEQLYATFARYILKHLNGLAFIQCIQDIQASGETVDLVRLREWLEKRGIHYPRGGKHPSIMRLWLEKAGIFVERWRLNEARLEAILGAPIAEVEILARFSPEQRAYLKTLANLGGRGPYASNDIEKLATATYGIKFNEKNLPKSVLYPLSETGYIVLERGTKESGRGAKPFLVTPTEKLQVDLLLPLLDQIERQTAGDLRPFLRKPLDAVLAEIDDESTHVRGLALEALAIKLMRLIDLTYVTTRLRGAVTGGAEVDVVFEASRLVFSRWQVQCKNTQRVALDDVAKEVGLTHTLKSNVIVIVSTGEIGPEARRYANQVMQDSNLCIIMIDRADMGIIATNPPTIVDVLGRESRHAMQIKKLDI